MPIAEIIPQDRDDDDLLRFEDAGDVENPLAVPLVAALQLVHRLRHRGESYKAALKSAIELLHTQDEEIRGLHRRNHHLLAELRGDRKRAA